jgi:predicted transcriptional regulator YdeE
MEIEIVQTTAIATYVGVRATEVFSKLGPSVHRAFQELSRRTEEILNIKNPQVTYGITPPNYKASKGLVDFFCCFEVGPVANVPPEMVLIRILPRTYSRTHYIGPASKTGSAYDYTSKWLMENGYAYDDVEYYFERYDEKTTFDRDDESSEVMIYCPVKRRETAI